MIQSSTPRAGERITPPSRELLILVAAAFVLWFIAIVTGAVFQLDRYVGDAPAYWGYSGALDEFTIYHLPLYPLILAPVHWFVPPDFHPLGIMTIITGAAWISGIVGVYDLLQMLNARYAALGAFIFGVFPIVGLGYALVPTSDIIGRTLVIWALLCYLKNRRWLTVFLIALILLTHKILWLNVVLFAVIALVQRRLSIVQVIAAGIPLAVYTLLGTFYHGSLTWIFSGSLEHTRIDTSSIQTHFPVFDTIIGRFLNGGIVNWLVGLLVLMVLMLAVFLLINRVWHKQPILMSFIIPSILIAAVMGASGSVVVLRFSPFLLIPLWLYLFPENQPRFKWLGHPAALSIVTLICLISQFFFLFYTDAYFA